MISHCNADLSFRVSILRYCGAFLLLTPLLLGMLVACNDSEKELPDYLNEDGSCKYYNNVDFPCEVEGLACNGCKIVEYESTCYGGGPDDPDHPCTTGCTCDGSSLVEDCCEQDLTCVDDETGVHCGIRTDSDGDEKPHISLNDACEQAPVLGCNDHISGDINDGYNHFSYYRPCSTANAIGTELIYSFTVDQDLDVQVTLSTGSSSKLLYLLSQCSNESCLEYDSALSRSAARIDFQAIAEKTYWIVVDTYEGGAGPFELDIHCPGIVSDGDLDTIDREFEPDAPEADAETDLTENESEAHESAD